MDKIKIAYGQTSVNGAAVKYDFSEKKDGGFVLDIFLTKDVMKNVEENNRYHVKSEDVEFEVDRPDNLSDAAWNETISNHEKMVGADFMEVSKKKGSEKITVFKKELKSDVVIRKVPGVDYVKEKSFSLYCNLTQRQMDEFVRNYLTQKLK